MQRVDPHPPVVVINGDLLGHHVTGGESTPIAVRIARRLNRAFPQAQFVLAMGNEDSACGDYTLAPDSAFLRDVAAAWEPLVNRRGAAPGFRRTFAHDGFYTARLPLPGLRAIVIDDIYWSPVYHARCGSAVNGGAETLAELRSALARTPDRAWVLFHIPPGIDTYTTALVTRRTVIVPYLTPVMRDRFLATLSNASGKIALAVAGHTHKFAFRIAGANGSRPVPMLLVPALSPVYKNEPSFLTGDVASDGTLKAADEYSYRDGAWSRVGGTRSLGLDAFTGPQLVALHERLGREPQLRATFARLYGGGASPEINDRNWKIYWCAATAFATTPFRACTQSGGVGIVTGRGITGILAVAVPIVAVIVWLIRRRSSRRARPLSPPAR
jgi:sphingomyelin phosphodiesterase acid-like 3